MKKSHLVSIFLVLLLLSSFLTMPASFVLNQIKLDRSIKLGNIQGTWWSFKVEWLSYNDFIQTNTQVSFKPSCLMTASICFDVKNDQTLLHINKSLLDNTLAIEDSIFNTNFSDLDPFLKNLLVKPTGSIEINIKMLKFNEQVLSGLSADINWHSIGVAGETFNLGSIQVNATHQHNLIRLKLSDQSTKLDLSGSVKISSNGFIDSKIQLKTLNTLPSSVKTIVQSVMKKRGHNIFEYKSKVSNRYVKRLGNNF